MNRKMYLAYNIAILKISYRTGSHIKSDNISETVQDSDVVTTDQY